MGLEGDYGALVVLLSFIWMYQELEVANNDGQITQYHRIMMG